jgi:hypothetical protein
MIIRLCSHVPEQPFGPASRGCQECWWTASVLSDTLWTPYTSCRPEAEVLQ